MKRRGIIVFTLFLVMLAGCNQEKKFEPDTFSKADLAIIKEDDQKFKVSYGMSRSDVEKLLGAPKKDSINSRISNYDFGVQVMYRNDMVAGIMLDTDSKEIYKTARGVSVGMTKEQIKEVYGSKYARDEHNLDYIYDSKNKRFTEELPEKEKEELEQIYWLSTMIVDGESKAIMLLDGRMASRMD